MQPSSPELQLGEWPALPWADWQQTAETLQLFMQIVGKTRLALTPTQNHWWNVPLYVTARGLETSAMPIAGGELLEIEFDLLAHELCFRSSLGAKETILLHPRTVADFFAEYQVTLKKLNVNVHLDPMPVELPDPIRFDLDVVHKHYDQNAVLRFFRVLRIADTLLKRFSTTFYGKISPVHFFWGSFDLAVTRFSGRPASRHEGRDAVQAEAYSHEVSSAGFWPGNGGYGQAAFYSYAAPVPEGLSRTQLDPPSRFDQTMGEFILDYEEARQQPNPASAVMNFLQATYAAVADSAHWDRRSLDRVDPVAAAALHC